MANTAIGPSPFEMSAVQAVATLSRDQERPGTSSVIDAMRRGVDLPRVEILEYLARCVSDWWIPLPLLQGFGYWGSRDWPPADPNYTELGLTALGAALAATAPRGEYPQIPLQLVNGDLHVGGQSPPFEPGRVMRALHNADASDLTSGPGPGLPWFRDNPVVEGDLDALLAGSSSEFRVSFRFEKTADVLMVRGFPPGVGPQGTFAYLAETMGRPDIELEDREDPDPEPRWLALSGSAKDLAEAAGILRAGLRYDFKLHAPWPELVRHWLETDGAAEGLAYFDDLDV